MEFLREVLSYDPRLLAQFFVLGIVVYVMLKSHFGKRIEALERVNKKIVRRVRRIPTIEQRTQDIFDLLKEHFGVPDTVVMKAARVGANLIESPTGELLAREMDRLKGRE